MIRDAEITDASALCGIYNYYIENTSVTFEEQKVSVQEMQHRIEDHRKDFPWLVCVNEAGSVTGYCYATKWRQRSAYSHSVELSIYVDKDQHKKGIATALYRELFPLLKNMNVHVMVAGISLPNDPSRLFHEKLGFSKIAQFREIGKKFGVWTDVGYWEYLF
jgi:L-amino acid N-acyltransferase YncA